MSAAHTPGPWKQDELLPCCIVTESNPIESLLCVNCTGEYKTMSGGMASFCREDDARLAAADPLLLEACEAADRVMWMAKEYAEAGGSGGPEMRDYTEAETVISAAIAKARGSK